jgi:hypothetical protein
VRTIKSSSTLSDPLKVYSLAKAVTSNMVLSESLNNVDRIASIALALKDIDLSQVVFVQVPTGGTAGGVLPSQPEFDDLFTAVAADQPLQLSGTQGRGATIDPNAPAPAPAPATAEPSATADPSATTDPNGTQVAVLPESATGQTAGEHTCSVGRTLDDQ